jgi:SAM-dependent methyltransferase
MGPALTARTTDRKDRYGGLLENPLISGIQRALLDAGRVSGLQDVLKPYALDSVLDAGCGLGECALIPRTGEYIGVDNSLPRIRHAAWKHKVCRFLLGDARSLPLSSDCVDAALMTDTSHHMDDETLTAVLNELRRVARRLVVVSDPVVLPGQNALSRFLYRMDRGACFRSENEMARIFERISGIRLNAVHAFTTYQRLYVRRTFILRRSDT